MSEKLRIATERLDKNFFEKNKYIINKIKNILPQLVSTKHQHRARNNYFIFQNNRRRN